MRSPLDKVIEGSHDLRVCFVDSVNSGKTLYPILALHSLRLKDRFLQVRDVIFCALHIKCQSSAAFKFQVARSKLVKYASASNIVLNWQDESTCVCVNYRKKDLLPPASSILRPSTFLLHLRRHGKMPIIHK